MKKKNNKAAITSTDFMVTEIPGATVMKKIAGELGYTEEQMQVIDSLKPAKFPVYIYADTNTRYWWGSNPSMIPRFKANLTWSEYLNAIKKDGDALQLLEADLSLARAALKNIVGSVKTITGAD